MEPTNSRLNVPALPIDAELPAIAAALAATRAVIIKAQPGAGKTTRVPAALLHSAPGKVVVLEPRRLAARLSAERVAAELGEDCGATVGYQLRFDQKTSDKTRLVFATEGVFLRRMQQDPLLRDVSTVVLDEFHERHIHTDLALALVRALQLGPRPDLRLVLMSATIDTTALAAYLPEARLFDVPGRSFPVASEYLSFAADAPLTEQVYAGVRRLLADPRCPGDILVFLPGAQDIRRCAEQLASLPQDVGGKPGSLVVLPLTAELAPAEQARVFQSSPARKIILATNVAETSLTIPGVTGVVDSGLAKIAGHASWSGMSMLDTRKISQAAAIQRAGRAGRVQPGVAYRLYSEADFLTRPAFTQPDIHRLDLAETLLSVAVLSAKVGRGDRSVAEALPWFEAPAAKAIEAAQQLLIQLGALTTAGTLTPLGSELAALPLHPRLAAVVHHGRGQNRGEAALAAACLISEGMALRRGTMAALHASSDVDVQIDLVSRVMHHAPLPRRLAEAVDDARARQAWRLYQQLARRLGIGPWPSTSTPPGDVSHQLGSCLLAGYPDRVAKKRKLPPVKGDGGRKPQELYNFCLGRGGFLSEASVVRDADLILALDVTASEARSADRGGAIHVAAELSIADLLEFPGGPGSLLSEQTVALWQEDAQRVDLMQRRSYGQLSISEVRLPVSPTAAAVLEELLRSKLAEHWPKPFADDSDLATYHARAAWLATLAPDADFPHFSGEMLELLQAAICDGKRSFKEIAAQSLRDYIAEQLTEAQRALLREYAPDELRLANGKRLRLYYEADKPPYLVGFVQDFYGVKSSPSLGRTALTLHLLGPNKRPLQVTSDLGGFWQRHYPGLRSEFGRRYPRHYWPEEATTAQPYLYYNQFIKAQKV